MLKRKFKNQSTSKHNKIRGKNLHHSNIVQQLPHLSEQEGPLPYRLLEATGAAAEEYAAVCLVLHSVN